MENAEVQKIECNGVRCTESAILEIDGNRVMVTVAKKDIERISIRHGVQSPNPTMQIILGVALASTACFPLRELIHWFQYGGTLFTDVDLLIPLPVIGAWTALEALKRGHFLEVHLRGGGIKRFAFKKRPEPTALNDLVSFVERNYQIPVLRADQHV